MVSIPDWSRWGRLQIDGGQGNNKTSPETLLAKYDRNRELEAIRMAEDSGYFLNVTAEVILAQHKRHARDGDALFDDIKRVQYLKFDNAHLRTPGSIDFCVRLQILCLPNNFLTSIDGLSGLKHLIKLDLKGNQIQSLPGMAFWGGLRQLQVLHLHDNPLGRTDAVSGLAGCRSLAVLTLFDTPLSLKRNYRHHVVNSVWTLRLLDHFVVSDEEIIEDAAFPGPRFKAFDPVLRINPCCPPKVASFREELQHVRRTVAAVTAVQKHHSPVLILQRWVRGYLTRRRLGIAPEGRSAARTVQSWWQSGAGDSARDDDLGHGASLEAAIAAVAATPESPRAGGDVSARPPSDTRSEAASTVVKGPTSSEKKEVELLPEHSPIRLMRSQMSSAATAKSKAPIFINLNQLDTGGKLPILDSAAAALDLVQPPEEAAEAKTSARPPLTSRAPRSPRKPLPAATTARSAPPRRVKDVRQFFGPVVPVLERTPEASPRESDTEIPLTAFRLRGLPPEIAKLDPVTELIIARTEAAKMVRDAEHEFHQQRLLEPAPVAQRQPIRTNDQRLFARVQGTMGTMLLQKWDRIDRDVHAQERQAAQMEAVMATRDARMQAKENLRLWKEEKKSKARQARQKVWRDSTRQIERSKLASVHENERYHWRRDRERQMRRTFVDENRFAQDFATQHNSVSKALLRHDRQALKEDREQARTEQVCAHRETEREQVDTVRKYLEHQRLMRQAEIAVQRAALSSKLLAETNDRLLNAHARVDRLRSLRRQAIEVSGKKQSYPDQDPLLMEELRSASRWEVRAAMLGGRVGVHPTA